MNGFFSICPDLKITSAQLLEEPSSPITMSAGRDSANELGQGLQILPNRCQWQALKGHLHCA